MATRTLVSQRRLFYQRHLSGQSYARIGADVGVSRECVRYWCRRQRDGGDVHTRYARSHASLLGRFDPKIRYVILRLRLEHPRWGPNRILARMRKRPSLSGLRLSSETQIGRYLHQWSRFRRQKRPAPRPKRPRQPTAVHQRWQLDFKVGIGLRDGTLVNLHTVRDPVGEACLGANIYPAGQVGRAPRKVKLPEVRATLRNCFARWETLPKEVQTDHETGLIGPQPGGFPPMFSLWLKGMGINHLLIRPGRPTDNAEVERCHRTLNDYGIAGQEKADWQTLQAILDQSVEELAFELSSRAEGCHGRPPVQAHPELLQHLRPYRPEWELACFDLGRVDRYLATLTWERTVGKSGQVYMANRTYYVGRRYARQQVMVTFDPSDRCFVFHTQEQPCLEIKRKPALGLEVADLTGIATDPGDRVSQQLPLPFIWLEAMEGVCC